ncbi:hypothetical protein BHE74_00046027, partial [Ensete ventricosum]
LSELWDVVDDRLEHSCDGLDLIGLTLRDAGLKGNWRWLLGPMMRRLSRIPLPLVQRARFL